VTFNRLHPDMTENNSQAGDGHVPSGTRSPLRWWICGGCVAAVAVVAFVWPSDSDPQDPLKDTLTNSLTDSPKVAEIPEFEPPVAPNPGYVGPDKCVACHEERVAEVRETNHFHTCRIPDAARMPPGFDPGRGAFTSRNSDIRFEMSREGDKYIQTSHRSSPGGDQTTVARIDLVYGAGTADDIYLSWRDDDRMYELPMAWLHPQQQWAAEYFDPHGSGDFSRPLTLRCFECHNTWFEYVPGSVNKYHRDNFIVGITCERCHGPGRDHVEFHETNPDETAAHAIVNPSELSRERQLEVCTQCHSNAMKHLGPALRYQPGKPLDEFYRTIHSPNPDHDHVANQIHYLRQSKCFNHSEQMTCTTCHDPHQSESSDRSGSASCIKCHEPAHCLEQDRLPMGVRNDCVGCHMPARYKINVNFQTEDDIYLPVVRRYDHQIAIDPVARMDVLLQWYRTQSDTQSQQEAAGLESKLVKHWEDAAIEFSREFRFFAAISAIREAIRVKPSPELQDKLRATANVQARLHAEWDEAIYRMSQKQIEMAIRSFDNILQVQPNNGEAHGRIGGLYAAVGQTDKALKHLQASIKYDPDAPNGHAMLGWLAYLDGRAEDALEHYARAEAVEPWNAKINHQIGLALATMNRVPEAIKRFRKALVIEPKRLETCRNLIQALRSQGESAEATEFAYRAVQLTHGRNADYLMMLAVTYAEASRFDEAADTAEQALILAKATGSDQVEKIRERLETYQKQAGDKR
jgi:tetratricopeptide (TPR) repeat protein